MKKFKDIFKKKNKETRKAVMFDLREEIKSNKITDKNVEEIKLINIR